MRLTNVDTAPHDVTINAGKVQLAAIWTAPANAVCTVAFAHGSGSSRHSMRNQFVARTLQQAGLATLLLDLLTPDEEEYDRRTDMLRFDVGFLARRLEAAIEWCVARREVNGPALGLFGASTGAAAALVAAARRPRDVAAVVSRGGRVDMAAEFLPQVQAPTLFIVGSNDSQVLELNLAAAKQLRSEHEVAVIAGASHLFEEPGTLERVAELARDWFLKHLVPAATVT
ncbi:MAG: dienelactone hydrolase family protein [Candidatus Eremiobacteraeota bacterium]|nr:dienelactone hydrolase family protein [Candidatus Eremiobacteraeota bacterium]